MFFLEETSSIVTDKYSSRRNNSPKRAVGSGVRISLSDSKLKEKSELKNKGDQLYTDESEVSSQ